MSGKRPSSGLAQRFSLGLPDLLPAGPSLRSSLGAVSQPEAGWVPCPLLWAPIPAGLQ